MVQVTASAANVPIVHGHNMRTPRHKDCLGFRTRCTRQFEASGHVSLKLYTDIFDWLSQGFVQSVAVLAVLSSSLSKWRSFTVNMHRVVPGNHASYGKIVTVDLRMLRHDLA